MSKLNKQRKISKSVKRSVAANQSYFCANMPNSFLEGLEQYRCPLWNLSGKEQGKFDASGYFIDHIKPFSIGGDNINNLQALCVACKSVKTTYLSQKANSQNTKNTNRDKIDEQDSDDTDDIDIDIDIDDTDDIDNIDTYEIVEKEECICDECLLKLCASKQRLSKQRPSKQRLPKYTTNVRIGKPYEMNKELYDTLHNRILKLEEKSKINSDILRENKELKKMVAFLQNILNESKSIERLKI